MKKIKTHVKKGDTVEITVGKFKGRTGKVLQVNAAKNTVLVEGGKMVKKTVKKSEQNPEGGIIDIEAPIHISNVKKIESKEKNTDK